MDQTFNESCCRANGVPEECMANCMDAREWDRFGLRMGKLHSRCTKYEKVIENCIVPVSNGNFSLLINAQKFILLRMKNIHMRDNLAYNLI